MISQDVAVNNNYVTVELLNAHMARLEAIMERNLALTRADIADFKAEIKQDIARIDSRIEVQNAKIDGLIHWNYWIIAVLVVIFIMPHVTEGFKAFFKSLADVFVSVFAPKSRN